MKGGGGIFRVPENRTLTTQPPTPNPRFYEFSRTNVAAVGKVNG